MFLKYAIRIPFALFFAVIFVFYSISLSKYFKTDISGAHFWFTVGFFSYLPIHLLFNRLIIIHVFAHELTHALWSVLFGGKIDEIYVSSRKGGFTRYSRGNFLVTLAPYFFPLYTLLSFGLFFIVRDELKPTFSFLAGFFFCFHFLLTLYSVKIGQPDLKQEGLFFSIPLILLMNLFVFSFVYLGLSDFGSFQEFVSAGFADFLNSIQSLKSELSVFLSGALKST